MQVDPVDADGHLKFFEDDSFRGQSIAVSDLITFRLEDFGQRMDPRRDALPCRGEVVFELHDHTRGLYAYLTNCGAERSQPAYGSAVRFDREAHLLESAGYRYQFDPANYMQFQNIAFKEAQTLASGSGWQSVASDSKLLIRADVRRFFTLNFDSDDIVSQLEDSRLGPVGNLARLSFYLKILFFKIKMSLATDVGFFADSGYIPMMVNLPVNAFDYLHPKSGILYSWRLHDALSAQPKTIHMPVLNPKEVEKGARQLANVGLSYCRDAMCEYRYAVNVGGRILSMDLGISRELVARGFFPIYVDNVASHQEAMGWPGSKEALEGRSAMYFEVSGLPEGGHPWSFWLRLGAPQDVSKACPATVRTSRLQNAPL